MCPRVCGSGIGITSDTVADRAYGAPGGAPYGAPGGAPYGAPSERGTSAEGAPSEAPSGAPARRDASEGSIGINGTPGSAPRS